MSSKNRKHSLSSMKYEFLALLPLQVRCEIEANHRKDFNFMEKARIQENLQVLFKKNFPSGRKSKDLNNDTEDCQNLGTLSSYGIERVDELIGRCTNESDEMVRKRRIIYKATKEQPEEFSGIIKKIDNNQMSIEYAARMVENCQRKNRPTPSLPKGEFDLICIDPPWDYKIPLSGAPPYKTMPLEELKKIKIPSSKDCTLMLWATNPMLEEALELIKHWGFNYKTKITWVKMKDGKLQLTTGHHIRGADEMLLIATKGRPGTPAEADRPPSVIFAPRTRHSEKPEVFYSIMETMHPTATKLEMFARKKRETGNWVQWGDEIEVIAR